MTQRVYEQPELYEIFSHLQDFNKEALFIVKEVRKRNRTRGRTLLNVGCGTGSHDLHLQKHFEVTGIDLNRDVLRLARKKNPRVAYRQGDMKVFTLGKRFNVITALTGVMLYNYSYEELKTTVENLHRHLEPGGVLIFNVAVVKEKAFGKNQRFLAFTESFSFKDMDVVVIDNPYDPDKRDTTFETHLVFLIRKNKGPLEVIVDKHMQGLFSLKRICRILEVTGFTYTLYENDFSGSPYKSLGPLFVCVRRA